MSTNEQKILVESGMSDEAMDRIKRMSASDTANDNIEMIEQEEQDLNDGVDFTLDDQEDDDKGKDKKADAEQKPDDQPPSDTASDGEQFDKSDFEDFLKQKGISEDEYVDKLFRNRKFKVKLNGKDQEVDYTGIKSVMSRENTFQKKYNALENSEEFKIGLIYKAAKSGDKGAQKRLKEHLLELTGSTDDTEMIHKLNDVTDKYDENEEFKKTKVESEFDEAFQDVKGSVDYEENMAKIDSDIRSFVPHKVFQAFWDKPQDRRVMYDLAASGRFDELSTAFQAELSTMPLEKQLEVESDPEMYGRAFVACIKRQNAKQSQSQQATKEDEGLSAVSSGTRSHTKPKSSVPDFASMSSAEFAAYKQKNGLM